MRLQSQRVLASMQTSSCQSEAAMLPWSVALTKRLLCAGLQAGMPPEVIISSNAAMPQCWQDCMGVQCAPVEQGAKSVPVPCATLQGMLSGFLNRKIFSAAPFDSQVQSGRAQTSRSGATGSDDPPSSWFQ